MLVEKRAQHFPVMVEKVTDLLAWREDGVYLDLTFGGGGHSQALLEKLSENARLFVVDLDEAAFERAKELESKDKRVMAIKDNFGNIVEIWHRFIAPALIDGVLADLGLSMMLIKESGRGFTFQKDEPLDMRFGDSEITAEEVLNTYTFNQLKKIFLEYGEEKKAPILAKEIIERRRKEKFRTTGQLVEVVEKVFGKGGKIHPATRIFQALRIEVNKELENLKNMLEGLPSIMGEGGRVVILTYHSLEDRIVKNYFLMWERKGLGKRINKKVIRPDEEEIRENPPSRSAKLRGFKFGRVK